MFFDVTSLKRTYEKFIIGCVNKAVMIRRIEDLFASGFGVLGED
jgi:hypothetical protein